MKRKAEPTQATESNKRVKVRVSFMSSQTYARESSSWRLVFVLALQTNGILKQIYRARGHGRCPEEKLPRHGESSPEMWVSGQHAP
jgi:hypothetical protein